MTERFARLGKAGAEEVSGVMRSTWEHVLDPVRESDGDVINFAGDAVLVLFTGEDHADRALSTARRVREALRELSVVDAPGGRVRLQMSIGVAHGEMDFVLAGARPEVLLTAGPAVDDVINAQSEAVAGQIIVSGDATIASPAIPVVPGDAGRFLPSAVRALVEAGDVEGEHRQATVAFVRIGGTGALSSDELAGHLHALVTRCQDAAEANGVTVLESDVVVDGVKLMLVAGAPFTVGDDADRMILSVLGSVAGPAGPLELSAGVHTGRVFAGAVGAEHRAAFTCLGDSTNTAARLAARAGAGEVLVSATTMSVSGLRLRAQLLEPMSVKGKSRPLVASRVDAVIGRTRRELDEQPPLVGRVREQDAIALAMSEARSGRGDVLRIVGDTGSGKTRLATTVIEAATTSAVVRCGPETMHAPYAAARELLGTPSLDTLIDRFPDLADRANDLRAAFGVASPSGSAGARRRTVVTLADAIGRGLPDGAAIVVEDAHWIDEPSSLVLREIELRHLPARGLILCVTRRPGEDDAESPSTLRLSALGDDDAAELVSAACAGRLLPAQVRAIVERGGGNPFFLLELTRAALEGGEPDALPDAIEGVIAVRLDGMPRRLRDAVRAAAVVGHAFDIDVVAAAADDPSLADPWIWQRADDLVDAEGPRSYRFRHSLLRDVAYERLPYRRRRHLHGRVADLLAERGAGPDILSLHSLAAQRYAEAWDDARAAARAAHAQYAPFEEAALLRRALAASRHVAVERTELARTWLALGSAASSTGALTEARRALSTARRLGLAPELEAHALLVDGFEISERLGDLGGGVRRLSKGVRVVALHLSDATGSQRAELESVNVRLLVGLGFLHLRQARFDHAERLFTRAAVDAERTNDRGGLAHAYSGLYLLYLTTGSPERERLRGLALPIYEELGDLEAQAQAVNHEGFYAFQCGRLDEAADLFERSRSLSARAGDAAGEALAASNRGEVLSNQGHLDAARESFDAATRIAQAVGDRLLLGVISTNLGRLTLRCGEEVEALELCERAARELDAIGAQDYALQARGFSADALLAMGRLDEALSLATELCTEAESLGVDQLLTSLYRARGVAAVATGDVLSARADLSRSLAIARELGLKYEEALTLAAIAQWCDDIEPDAAGRANTMFEEMGVVRP